MSVLGGISSTGSGIPINADLNTYTSFGYFISGSSADVPSLSNKPDGLTKAFKLEVRAGITDQPGRVIQTIYAIDGSVFTRTRDSNIWSAWGRMDGYGCSTPEALASLLGGLFQYVSGLAAGASHDFNISERCLVIVNNSTYARTCLVFLGHPTFGQNGQHIIWQYDDHFSLTDDSAITYLSITSGKITVKNNGVHTCNYQIRCI